MSLRSCSFALAFLDGRNPNTPESRSKDPCTYVCIYIYMYISYVCMYMYMYIHLVHSGLEGPAVNV